MVQKQEFYRQTIQEAAASLHTDPKRGLSAQEAERRLWENGENRLPEAEKKSVLQSFLEQLNDPLIYVLLAAALISVLLGEYSDAGIIAFVVCLNAAVGRKFRRQSLLWVIWSAYRRWRWFPRICGLWRRRIYSSRRRR